MNMYQAVKTTIGEHRMLYWFKEVGSNLKTLGEEMKDDVTEAIRSDDVIKMIATPFALAVKVVVSGPNAITSGILDDKTEKANDYKTLEEGGAAVENLMTGHPLRAINHGWNAFTVWSEDLARSLAGLSSHTRSRVQSTLEAA